MASTWHANLQFLNNITPLDHDHMQNLVDNLEYLYDKISVLITNSGGATSPLPTASGDGMIRYVVTVNQDMIYVGSSTNNPTVSDPGRYFVAVLDSTNASTHTYTYHLEIWNYLGGNTWATNSSWATTIDNINYTNKAWDKCTHDKLYICKNINKCYYMNSNVGSATLNHTLVSGDIDDASAFMTETAQSCSQIFKGSCVGEYGMSRSMFDRFKVVAISFTFATSGGGDRVSNIRSYETDAPGLYTVAFDPWCYKTDQGTQDGYLYVPINIAYGNNEYGARIGGKDMAFLRVYNSENDDKFLFDVVRDIGVLDSGNLAIDIKAVVGVADIMTKWLDF